MSAIPSSQTPPGLPVAGAVILAAGKGTRMHTDTPKVLCGILEEPMLRYVYDAVVSVVGDRAWTVVGHKAELLHAAFPEQESRFILQEKQLGTGHALRQAWSSVVDAGTEHVLVINGDTPLLPAGILRDFLLASVREKADIAFISLTLDNPGAFGRVVRKDKRIAAIVEAKDYVPAVYGPEPNEINAGIYYFRTATVTPLLPLLFGNNKSGELYITDLVALGVSRDMAVYGHLLPNEQELSGVNSPEELVRAEEYLRNRLVGEHVRNGVIIRSPHTVRIGPDVRIERGVEITGPCELYGKSVIGRGVRIASHCRLADAAVAEGVVMHSFCHVEKARIGTGCIVGPYARLRPGSEMEEGAYIGNFVEMKQSRLGKGAKANHLSYLGDADIGDHSNIGAGTITCNYDGQKKHRTTVGEKSFIGSNTSLVAPVNIGSGAMIGAGSTITKDVPENSLGISRAPQRLISRKRIGK